MSQHRTGTASVSKGSSVVTGTNTLWLANAAPGHGFKVQGEKAVYTINSVDGDGTLQISPPYAGSSKADVGYIIWRDFTVNVGLYEPAAGDVEWPFLLTQSMRKLDSVLAGSSSYGSPFGVITLCGLDNGANRPGAALQAEIQRLIDSGVPPEKIVWFSTGTESAGSGQVGATTLATAVVAPLAGSLGVTGARSGSISLAAAALTPLAGSLGVTGVQAGVGSIPLAAGFVSPAAGVLGISGRQVGLVPLPAAVVAPSAGTLALAGVQSGVGSIPLSAGLYTPAAGGLTITGDRSGVIPMVTAATSPASGTLNLTGSQTGAIPIATATIAPVVGAMGVLGSSGSPVITWGTRSFIPSAGTLAITGTQTGTIAMVTGVATSTLGVLGLVGHRSGLISLTTTAVDPTVDSLGVVGAVPFTSFSTDFNTSTIDPLLIVSTSPSSDSQPVVDSNTTVPGRLYVCTEDGGEYEYDGTSSQASFRHINALPDNRVFKIRIKIDSTYNSGMTAIGLTTGSDYASAQYLASIYEDYPGLVPAPSKDQTLLQYRTPADAYMSWTPTGQLTGSWGAAHSFEMLYAEYVYEIESNGTQFRATIYEADGATIKYRTGWVNWSDTAVSGKTFFHWSSGSRRSSSTIDWLEITGA